VCRSQTASYSNSAVTAHGMCLLPFQEPILKPPPTAIYPSGCPLPGVTFESNGRVDLAGSSILVGIDSHRTMEIVPIDCFPGSCLDPDGRSVLSVELAFSPSERGRVERAIAAADSVMVTIPEPYVLSRDWMTELASSDPKPGYVWISETETVTDVLTGGLVSRGRRVFPPYPTDSYRSENETQSPRPAVRPAPGLTLQIKPTQLLCESADLWRATTLAGHELVVSLLDCYGTLEKYEKVLEVLDACDSSLVMAITLPPPVDSVDWLESLKPGTLHAGYIWLGDITLNQILVDRGIAVSDAK
jgi:hypothetical protein